MCSFSDVNLKKKLFSKYGMMPEKTEKLKVNLCKQTLVPNLQELLLESWTRLSD